MDGRIITLDAATAARREDAMIGGSHYDTLGLPPNATAAEIREAFTARAAGHNLSLRSSYTQRLRAREALARLRAAYETLADPRRRAEYDWRLGIDDLQPLDWGGARPEPEDRGS